MSTLANSYSLSNHVIRYYDQQNQGACVATAICGAATTQMHEAGISLPLLSTQQLYNDTRTAQGTFGTDSGSVVQIAFNVAQNVGIGNNSSFDFGSWNLYSHPNQLVHDEAARQKTTLNFIESGGSYTTLHDTIALQLMRGKPVLIAATNLQYSDGASAPGSHYSYIDGYNDSTSQYDVVNSYGSTYDGDGHQQVNYTAFANSQSVESLAIINTFGATDTTWSVNRIKAAQIYTTSLNRCGEHSGIEWWANVLNNASSGAVANALVNSLEGQLKYGSLTNADFIQTAFHQVLNRDAESSAVDFYSNWLANGVTRGDLIAHLTDYISTYSGTDVSTKMSHDSLQNRTTVSMNFGTTYQASDNHHDIAVASLNGVTDNADTVSVALIGIQISIGLS